MIILRLIMFLLIFIYIDEIFIIWIFLTIFYLLTNFSSYYNLITEINIIGLFVTDYFNWFMIFLNLWLFIYLLFILTDTYSFLIFILMLFSLTLSFLINSYLMFYVLFEFVFMLIFFYLLGWGYNIERVQSSFYILFYTMVFSLPFFVLLIHSYNDFSSLSFSIFKFIDYENINNKWIMLITLVFIVKLPLYGFHIWLPKAHVEAPTIGSIILAGILLKLGGYGLYRSINFIVLTFDFMWLDIVLYISILGSLYISLLCLRQTDYKVIVAYSSVIHIRIIYIAIFSFSEVGVMRSLLILISHGFISSSLFFLLGNLYELIFSRRIFIIKGIIIIIPIFSIIWFINLILNLGFPPSMSFFSEVLMFGSLSILETFNIFFLFLLFLFCGFYSIFLYVFITHGFFLYKEINNHLIIVTIFFCFIQLLITVFYLFLF